jgi:hypothetical protein
MRHAMILSAAATAAFSGSALATVIGNQVFGDSYLVVDGGKTYSVLDVYAKSDKATDAFASVYGVSFYKASWTQVQGLDFKHVAGTSWNPNSPDAASWDSFVTLGMRVQAADEYGFTPIALTPNGFSNISSTVTTSNNRLRGFAGGNGPGWYPSVGAHPSTNPFCSFGYYNGQTGTINTAKATGNIAGNGIAAGQSLDNHFMIGRFTIDITDVVATAVEGDFTMHLKFAMTVVSDGVTRTGSTNADFRVDQTLSFAVPAPGAAGLLALAGLGGRRRRG